MTQSISQPKEQELLRQLVGEWSVGIDMKTPDGKVVAGCGEMTAIEIAGTGINSEINAHIEGYEDYFENDLWSFDRATGKVHLFSVTSEGESHDHVGNWVNEKTLELLWSGLYGDLDVQEQITAVWVSKDQIELKETIYKQGKPPLVTNYVFKRRELGSKDQAKL